MKNKQTEELAIRFVNTRAWRLRKAQEERLVGPWELLNWCVQVGLLAKEDVGDIPPNQANKLHKRAIVLREACYELFRGVAGLAPANSTALSEILKATELDGASLTAKGRHLVWRFDEARHALLAPIAISALALATGPWSERVKQCADDRGCGWLFVDESRAQNRRWCSMGDCGNRAKAARHYRRSRTSTVEPT